METLSAILPLKMAVVVVGQKVLLLSIFKFVAALENEAENPQRNDVIEATVIPITSDNRTDTDVVIL